jgi:hypothetical protein
VILNPMVKERYPELIALSLEEQWQLMAVLEEEIMAAGPTSPTPLPPATPTPTPIPAPRRSGDTGVSTASATPKSASGARKCRPSLAFESSKKLNSINSEYMSIELLEKYHCHRVSFRHQDRKGSAVLIENPLAGAWALSQIHWLDDPREDSVPILVTDDMIRTAQEIQGTLVLGFPINEGA